MRVLKLYFAFYGITFPEVSRESLYFRVFVNVQGRVNSFSFRHDDEKGERGNELEVLGLGFSCWLFKRIGQIAEKQIYM